MGAKKIRGNQGYKQNKESLFVYFFLEWGPIAAKQHSYLYFNFSLSVMFLCVYYIMLQTVCYNVVFGLISSHFPQLIREGCGGCYHILSPFFKGSPDFWSLFQFFYGPYWRKPYWRFLVFCFYYSFFDFALNIVMTQLISESSNSIGTRNEMEYDTGPAI